MLGSQTTSDVNAHLARRRDSETWAATADEHHESYADTAAVSEAGLCSLLAVASSDRTGISRLLRIERRRSVDAAAVALLERWIEQFGADMDEDLDRQRDELRQSRLALHSPC
jgi:hypothetical protein